MEGKITISSEEVKALVSDWVKLNVLMGKDIHIDRIFAKHYAGSEIDVEFSNEPEEEEPKEEYKAAFEADQNKEVTPE